MKLSDYENDQSYRQIIEKLEPRHAPETSIKFSPHQKKRRVRGILLWTSRVAALFVVGLLMTLFISQSQTTNGAVKVLESGIENMRTSGYCNIDFSARMLTSKNAYALKLSPRGDMQPATLTYKSDNADKEISLRWFDGQSQHQLTMFPGREVKFDGNLISDISMPSEVFSIMSNLLFSPNPDYKKILDSNTLEMTTNGDEILVRNIGKHKKVEFCIKFSKSSGRLLDFYAFDTSHGEKILMIKTEKITYKNTLISK